MESVDESKIENFVELKTFYLETVKYIRTKQKDGDEVYA